MLPTLPERSHTRVSLRGPVSRARAPGASRPRAGRRRGPGAGAGADAGGRGRAADAGTGPGTGPGTRRMRAPKRADGQNTRVTPSRHLGIPPARRAARSSTSRGVFETSTSEAPLAMTKSARCHRGDHDTQDSTPTSVAGRFVPGSRRPAPRRLAGPPRSTRPRPPLPRDPIRCSSPIHRRTSASAGSAPPPGPGVQPRDGGGDHRRSASPPSRARPTAARDHDRSRSSTSRSGCGRTPCPIRHRQDDCLPRRPDQYSNGHVRRAGDDAHDR